MADVIEIIYMDMPSSRLEFHAHNAVISRILVNGENYVKDLSEEEYRANRRFVHEEIMRERSMIKLIQDMQRVIENAHLQEQIPDFDERIARLELEGV